MRLVAVTQRADATYRLTFERGTARWSVTPTCHPGDTVHSPTSSRVAPGLPPVKRRVINELGYGTNAKLLGQYATVSGCAMCQW